MTKYKKDNELIVNGQKKKKKKNGIIIVLLIIVVVLIFLKISKVGNILDSDPSLSLENSLSSSEKFWFIFVGFIVTGCMIGFAMLPKKINRIFVATIETLFISFIWPMMFFSIILLGALEAKYPDVVYTNGTFAENLNKTFSISMGAVSSAFQKMTLAVYNIGAESYSPNLWIIFFILLTIALILMITTGHAIKNHLIEDLDAQELIDSLTHKDYQDLMKYEQKLKQKHWWSPSEKKLWN